MFFFSFSTQDGTGWTALHHAAANGQETVIQLLLSHGADSRGGGDGRTDGGETALSLACDGSHTGVVRALLRSGQVNPTVSAGRGASCRLPLQIAAATGRQYRILGKKAIIIPTNPSTRCGLFAESHH